MRVGHFPAILPVVTVCAAATAANTRRRRSTADRLRVKALVRDVIRSIQFHKKMFKKQNTKMIRKEAQKSIAGWGNRA